MMILPSRNSVRAATLDFLRVSVCWSLAVAAHTKLCFIARVMSSRVEIVFPYSTNGNR
jgi:hypothetical protein